MPQTIGNPLSWAAHAVGSTFGYVRDVTNDVGMHDTAAPVVRQITTDDLRTALRRGFDDMNHFRSDVIFVCLLYPILGITMAALALQGDYLYLVFPFVSGFALAGPVAAVGLYEMSRRRERGEPTSWAALFDVAASPRFGAIMVLALVHAVVFAAWIMAADMIWRVTLGDTAFTGIGSMAGAILGSGAGWALIILGCGVGFVFASMVLAMSVVSFPLLLDRNVGLAVAVRTSVEVARANPRVIAIWGAIVAGLLALGFVPFMLGLVIVMPLLGHATWHLYRAAVR
jgi:uncharacterized membrane protein